MKKKPVTKKRKNAKFCEPLAVVLHGDCVKGMQKLGEGSVQLCCADPPYNLGRNYDKHNDQMSETAYLSWASQWLCQIYRVLHPHGSFWLAMHDSLVSEMDMMAKAQGFHKRGHIIWAYTFGVNCTRNFTRAHTHWLYYTKAKTKYTFNQDDPALRVPSARQLVYNDKRANPKGRLPDDVWILRPGELQECFNGHSDVWLESRVCGTFHARVKGMDNQMPMEIMLRIIRACSKKGDTVLDPFLGTGTTGVAAAMLKRNFLGFDISAPYCVQAARRIRFAGAHMA